MNYNKIIYLLIIVFVVLLVACFTVSSTAFAKQNCTVKVTSNNALKDGEYFSIQLSDANGNPLANQVVNITIVDANGGLNHQQVTTDASGNGKFQLNGLASGEYTFNVNYGGDKDFNPCNSTVKITVGGQTPSTSSSTQPSDWYDSEGVHHFYENGKEYVGSRNGQHMDIDTHNHVKEHGMGD